MPSMTTRGGGNCCDDSANAGLEVSRPRWPNASSGTAPESRRLDCWPCRSIKRYPEDVGTVDDETGHQSLAFACHRRMLDSAFNAGDAPGDVGRPGDGHPRARGFVTDTVPVRFRAH